MLYSFKTWLASKLLAEANPSLSPLRRLRSAVLPALLFWLGWWLAHSLWPYARWLPMAAQMWLAYSLAWLVLPWRLWALWVPLAALLGGVVSLLLLPGFGLVQWSDFGMVWRRALPATAFALMMHLPLRWWRWREERAVQLRLSRAEQTAAMADLSRQVSVAELKTMQAQVEPHFLFNSLASLQQLIRHDPALAERFLGEFHDYLRLALPSMRESLSTVEKELALARAYLTIMVTRLGGRLQFDVHLAPDCAAHPMPPMMLPTLVENAVQHGIEPQAQGGRVEISARRVDQSLQVEVCDTGIGLLAAAQQKSKGQGLGLANVRDRLASLYDGAARITVQERDGGGVCARIDLPWAVDPMSTPEVS